MFVSISRKCTCNLFLDAPVRQLLNGSSVGLMEIIVFFDYNYVYMHSFSSIKLCILKNTVYIYHKPVHYINVYEHLELYWGEMWRKPLWAWPSFISIAKHFLMNYIFILQLFLRCHYTYAPLCMYTTYFWSCWECSRIQKFCIIIQCIF